MDVLTYNRMPDTSASETPVVMTDIVRVETTIVSDGGEQFQVMLLDADDSFDVAVKWPNGESEIVWSLVRERTIEG